MKRRYKTLLAVLALAAVATVSAGVARSTGGGTIPDANGVIHACYKKPVGEVKIVYSAHNCTSGQVPIEWSQTGPQGPKGDPGSQGPAGPPGAAGGGVQVFDNGTHSLFDVEVVAETGIFLHSVLLGGPGTYWVTAKGRMRELGPQAASDVTGGNCRLEVDGSELDTTHNLFFNDDEAGEVHLFTLAAVTFVPQAGQLADIVCAKLEADPLARLHIGPLRITALKVS